MKRLALLALLAPLCLTAPATAALRSSGTVIVHYNERRVAANVGNTHNSNNGPEAIQCELSAYPTHSSVRCWAQDTTGVRVACSYTNPPPSMIAAVSAIGPDSNVHFAWSTSGQCTYILVHNGSTTYTKNPQGSFQSVMLP